MAEPLFQNRFILGPQARTAKPFMNMESLRAGPYLLHNHGGSCSSCHGDRGQGGVTPMMCLKPVHPVTLKALLGDGPSHGVGHANASHPIETIQNAILQGISSDGYPMDPCMPKWGLNEGDSRGQLFHMKLLGE